MWSHRPPSFYVARPQGGTRRPLPEPAPAGRPVPPMKRYRPKGAPPG